MKTVAASLVGALAFSTTTALAAVAPVAEKRDSVTPVTVKGNAFFKGDERFYIRGIDYQPGGSSQLKDPIAEPETCKRDIKKFKELGANTIRIYSVDNSVNHDECMDALAEEEIYLVLDVNTPDYSLNREDPHPSYNEVYLQNIFATMEAFAKYPNTLAFFSGNEVINDGPTSASAPYVKAVTRDMRRYLRERGLRKIPVGYSAADVNENRQQMAEYMNCGPEIERSDFFAFNDYSWCSPSSFEGSGWAEKVETYKNYGIPLFLSEYGCTKTKRTFEEVEALYSKEMTGVYSGGLVYEYSQEDGRNYGLVEIKGDTVSDLPDFKALKSAFEKTANPEGDGGYNSTGGASGCPAKEGKTFDVKDDSLPALPVKAEQYFKDGPGKGVGFGGDGSQTAGTPSEDMLEPGTTTGSGSSPSETGAAGTIRVAAGLLIAPLVAAFLA
ncbi:beta-glucanosyltransferase [Arachnomyces sp. PD_36]|nr:beta-glucanosyltransferase [Arachnomyces sp. PD_36]